MAYRWIVNGFIFINCLLLGLSMDRFITQKKLVNEIRKAALNRPLAIESVPNINVPDEVGKLKVAEFTVDYSVQFNKDGTISDLHYQPVVSLKARVRADSGVEISQASANKARTEVVDLITKQIKNVKFQPRLSDGKPVDKLALIRVRFLNDCRGSQVIGSDEMGEGYFRSCTGIEITIEADGVEVWNSRGGQDCLVF